MHFSSVKVLIALAVASRLMTAPQALGQQGAVGVQEFRPIEIPFEWVGTLHMPKDGEIALRVVDKENVWPNEKDPFERDQSIEIALGKGIRAQQRHRNDEKNLGHGLIAEAGYIGLEAGWRAKWKFPVIGDHFDGTVKAKVEFENIGGQLKGRVYDVRVKWNKGVGDVAVDTVLKVEQKMEILFTKNTQALIDSTLKDWTDDFFKKNPVMSQHRNFLSMGVVKGGLQISFRPGVFAETPKPGVKYCIQSNVSRLFLDVRDGEKAVGSPITQALAHPAQTWELIPSENHKGFFYIRSSVSGLNLDVLKGSAVEGQFVVQGKPHPDQVWELVPAEKKGHYYIKSRLAKGQDLFLDVNGGSKSIGANICISKKNPDQIWAFSASK